MASSWPARQTRLSEGLEEVGPVLQRIARHGALADIHVGGGDGGRKTAMEPADRAARYGAWLRSLHGDAPVPPHLAASLFLKSYASHLITPLVTGFVLERTIADVSLGNAWVAERGARPIGVRLRTPRAVIGGSDTDLMHHFQTWAMDGHLRRVVEDLRRSMAALGCTLAPRMLWEDVAAACVYTFSVTGADPRHRGRSDSLMTDFLLGIPRYGGGLLGEVRTHLVDDQRQLLVTRHTCCLKNQLPGAPTCLECPKLDVDTRAALVAARVRAGDVMPGFRLLADELIEERRQEARTEAGE